MQLLFLNCLRVPQELDHLVHRLAALPVRLVHVDLPEAAVLEPLGVLQPVAPLFVLLEGRPERADAEVELGPVLVPRRFHPVEVQALDALAVHRDRVAVREEGVIVELEPLQEAVAADLGDLRHLIDRLDVPALPVVQRQRPEAGLEEPGQVTSHVLLVQARH